MKFTAKQKQDFILVSQPQWKHDGYLLQERRLALGVSLRALAQKVGVSTSVIAKFEKGNPIQRRKLVETSCWTALESIQLAKQILLDNLEVNKPSCLQHRRR